MTQDNDSYRDRAALAVINALLESARTPGSSEINVNLASAMDALCQAIVDMAAQSTKFDRDHDEAADMIDAFEQHVSAELRMLARKMRDGAVTLPRARPTLRIVT